MGTFRCTWEPYSDDLPHHRSHAFFLSQETRHPRLQKKVRSWKEEANGISTNSQSWGPQFGRKDFMGERFTLRPGRILFPGEHGAGQVSNALKLAFNLCLEGCMGSRPCEDY